MSTLEQLMRENLAHQREILKKIGAGGQSTQQIVQQVLSESQPKGNFFQAAVTPLSLSKLQLPGGSKTPFHYCLGVDSTIPYVSLQGGGSSQKVFTWGEMIEVPPGQTVTVKNESFMLGDIQINSGNDYAAKPERISLPVDIVKTDTPAGGGTVITNITPKFPADTRRCRRGYLKFQIQSGSASLSLIFRGKPIKHSFPATDSVTGAQTYTQPYNIPPFTNVGEAPMGYGSNDDLLTPMAFTDQVTWGITYVSASAAPGFIAPVINTLFMYVLEY